VTRRRPCPSRDGQGRQRTEAAAARRRISAEQLDAFVGINGGDD